MLICNRCPNIISIPNKYFNLLEHDKCIWLNIPDNQEYDNNIQKLNVLQNWFRRNIRFWIFMLRSPYGLKMDKKCRRCNMALRS